MLGRKQAIRPASAKPAAQASPGSVACSGLHKSCNCGANPVYSLRKDLLASYKKSLLNERVGLAVQEPRSDGSSSPEASLHCISPEEDA